MAFVFSKVVPNIFLFMLDNSRFYTLCLFLYQTIQSVPSTSMMLPPGAPTLVEVRIRDAWGGVATVRLAVNVSALDLSDASAHANAVGAMTKTALDSLAQATSVGSMDAAAQVSVFVCELQFDRAFFAARICIHLM